MSEYEIEPVPGLPEPLPEGEHILWQGAPRWWRFACSVFHVRMLALYFALLMVWRGGTALADGQSLTESALAGLWLAQLGAVAIGVLLLMAWLYSRTTIYTVTNRRLVLRFGIALPVVVNLPFHKVQSAALRTHADGSGDIPLTLTPGEQMSYLLMWPNVRPWQLGRPRPMLRAIPDAARAADILSAALARALGEHATRRSVASAARPAASAATGGSLAAAGS
jgi:hypothetical protein